MPNIAATTPDPALGDDGLAEPGLHPVAPAYRTLIRLRSAINFAVLLTLTGAGLAPMIAKVDALEPWRALLGGLWGALLIAAIAVVAMAPSRRWARTAYGFNDRLLRVARGWIVRTDTIVPLIRVQHSDVRRGPIEKALGLATLVVHTAGTHNATVEVPGLTPAMAEAIRSAIRARTLDRPAP